VIRKSSTTQKVIESAAARFLSEGFAAVSVDQIARAAGITKMTVYQHFRSKEDLLLQCLRWRLARRDVQLDELVGDRSSGECGVLQIFDWMASNAEGGQFAGCAFLKATSEVGTSMPEVREIAREAKRTMRERLIKAVRKGGIAEPESLGSLCALLLEGAQALSLIERSSEPFHTARAQALALSAAHNPNRLA